MSHMGAPGLVRHPISTNTASSEQPSVITRYSTLAPDAAYASSGEETSLASFEIFSAAAGLRARSETAGTTSPRLKAVRSPRAVLPRATGRVALPQRAETDFYGEYTVFERSELSAYRFTARHLQSATCQGCNLCVRARAFCNLFEPTRTGFLKMGVGIGEPQHLPQPCSDDKPGALT